MLSALLDSLSSKAAETCLGSGLSVSDRLREKLEFLEPCLSRYSGCVSLSVRDALLVRLACSLSPLGGAKCFVSKEDGGIIYHCLSMPVWA